MEGPLVGSVEGSLEGPLVGSVEGSLEGPLVGTLVGVGELVGELVGVLVVGHILLMGLLQPSVTLKKKGVTGEPGRISKLNGSCPSGSVPDRIEFRISSAVLRLAVRAMSVRFWM